MHLVVCSSRDTIGYMKAIPTFIEGCFEIESVLYSDERGSFAERFRSDRLFEQTGHVFDVKQLNVSISKKNVFRGIHFAGIPAGQAKYVSVMSGSIIDYVVDLRIGSSTFGNWQTFELTSSNNKSLFIAEGLGHGFLSLADQTQVAYLVSEVYSPTNEFELNPLDETLGLTFPVNKGTLNFSEKDRTAPRLEALMKSGVLPTFQQAIDQYANNLHKIESQKK